jgi:spore photoproduct lyase
MRERRGTHPKILLVEDSAREDPVTHRVLSRLPDAKVVYVTNSEDPLYLKSEVDTAISELLGSVQNLSDAERFSLGKRVLMLKRHKGSWLKSCPGTSGHVCCNLFIVNPGEGCPLDCTYCYLQSYLKNNPTLKLYTNTCDLFDELADKFTSEPGRLFRVGTGELIDSLVWDDLTDATLDFVPFFAKFKNAVLELKSKDDYVENLVSLRNEHKGQTVVSWSVNAARINKNDEANTATLTERIEAAGKVVEAGYRVGFHFDPIVHFEGWEDEYYDTIQNIFSKIPKEKIAWVSISSLRYKTDLQDMMKSRFPDSVLPYGEQFLARDAKLRYIQPVRFRMLRFMWDELKKISDEMPVYMCMESAAAWKGLTGGTPTAGEELREVFARRASLPVIS